MAPFRIIFSLRRDIIPDSTQHGRRTVTVTSEVLPFYEEATARAAFSCLVNDRHFEGGNILDMHLERLTDTLVGHRWHRMLTSESLAS